MALLINKQYTGVAQDGKQYTADYALHGMRRDETGLLTYSKIGWWTGEAIQMDNGEGTAYNSLGEFQINELDDGTNINSLPREYSTGNDPRVANPKYRFYDQHVFESSKVFYYMDSLGRMVARINEEFVYNQKDGATRNWTT